MNASNIRSTLEWRFKAVLLLFHFQKKRIYFKSNICITSQKIKKCTEFHTQFEIYGWHATRGSDRQAQSRIKPSSIYHSCYMQYKQQIRKCIMYFLIKTMIQNNTFTNMMMKSWSSQSFIEVKENLMIQFWNST